MDEELFFQGDSSFYTRRLWKVCICILKLEMDNTNWWLYSYHGFQYPWNCSTPLSIFLQSVVVNKMSVFLKSSQKARSLRMYELSQTWSRCSKAICFVAKQLWGVLLPNRHWKANIFDDNVLATCQRAINPSTVNQWAALFPFQALFPLSSLNVYQVGLKSYTKPALAHHLESWNPRWNPIMTSRCAPVKTLFHSCGTKGTAHNGFGVDDAQSGERGHHQSTTNRKVVPFQSGIGFKPDSISVKGP